MVQLNCKKGECLLLKAVSLRHCWWSPEGSCAPQQMWWWEHLSDVSVSTLMGRCFGKVNTESFTCNLTDANTNTLVFADCWKHTEGTTEELKHSCWMSPNSPSFVLHGGWALRGSPCRRIRSVSVPDVTQAFSAPCSSSLFKGIDAAFQLCWHLDVRVNICARPSRTTAASKHSVFLSFIHLFCPIKAS